MAFIETKVWWIVFTLWALFYLRLCRSACCWWIYASPVPCTLTQAFAWSWTPPLLLSFVALLCHSSIALPSMCRCQTTQQLVFPSNVRSVTQFEGSANALLPMWQYSSPLWHRYVSDVQWPRTATAAVYSHPVLERRRRSRLSLKTQLSCLT